MTTHPALTKITTGACVFGLGDLGCQALADGTRVADIDVPRLARAAVFGGGFSLWLHYWWGALEKWGHGVVPVERYGVIPNTLFKLFFDQTVSAVLFNAGYIAATNCKDGASISQIADSVETQLPGYMLAHWKFWPAFHFINFSVVPLHYRVVIMNFVKVGWSGLMSQWANQSALSALPSASEVCTGVADNLGRATLIAYSPLDATSKSYFLLRRFQRIEAECVQAQVGHQNEEECNKEEKDSDDENEETDEKDEIAIPWSMSKEYKLSENPNDTAGTEVMDGDTCDVPSLMEMMERMESNFSRETISDGTSHVVNHAAPFGQRKIANQIPSR
jgi:hypothetical protein